ncbi:hypothetical protein [uncultured Brachyspira sp.]|uniref:hypothetical protein n=1 Tax=uncultured Brachyspira sp. TaxID=221953 RepID=UPI00259B1DC0|nr:hypothetical protein [uncultured Brachyspira sp.]
MNNTKTIFKSLLIMIVAISLFTVSCSKDEGGTKTPTTPTIQKISATDITTTLRGIKKLTDTDQAQTLILDFETMTEPASGEATINGANKSFSKVKTALIEVFKVQQNVVKLTTDLTDSTPQPSGSAALQVIITFTAKSGFEFDTTITDGSKYAYDGNTKKATLTLNIKPAAAWEQ